MSSLGRTYVRQGKRDRAEMGHSVTHKTRCGTWMRKQIARRRKANRIAAASRRVNRRRS